MTDCPDSCDLLAKVREKIMKCKSICLDNLGYSFDTNPRSMGKYEKDKLIQSVELYMTKPDEEVDNEFNRLVCDKWLISGKDYSTYPIYDIAGNKIDK